MHPRIYIHSKPYALYTHSRICCSRVSAVMFRVKSEVVVEVSNLYSLGTSDGYYQVRLRLVPRKPSNSPTANPVASRSNGEELSSSISQHSFEQKPASVDGKAFSVALPEIELIAENEFQRDNELTPRRQGLSYFNIKEPERDTDAENDASSVVIKTAHDKQPCFASQCVLVDANHNCSRATQYSIKKYGVIAVEFLVPWQAVMALLSPDTATARGVLPSLCLIVELCVSDLQSMSGRSCNYAPGRIDTSPASMLPVSSQEVLLNFDQLLCRRRNVSQTLSDAGSVVTPHTSLSGDAITSLDVTKTPLSMHAHCPVLFDYVFLTLADVFVHSSVVGVERVDDRSLLNDDLALQSAHDSLCRFLLTAAFTLHSVMSEFADLVTAKRQEATSGDDSSSNAGPIVDIDDSFAPDVQLTAMRRVLAENAVGRRADVLRTHIAKLSTETLLLWRCFQLHFVAVADIHSALVHKSHQARRKRFSAAFFTRQLSKNDIALCLDGRLTNTKRDVKHIRSSKYLTANLAPLCPLQQLQIDPENSALPIIFQDVYCHGKATNISLTNRMTQKSMSSDRLMDIVDSPSLDDSTSRSLAANRSFMETRSGNSRVEERKRVKEDETKVQLVGIKPLRQAFMDAATLRPPIKMPLSTVHNTTNDHVEAHDRSNGSGDVSLGPLEAEQPSIGVEDDAVDDGKLSKSLDALDSDGEGFKRDKLNSSSFYRRPPVRRSKCSMRGGRRVVPQSPLVRDIVVERELPQTPSLPSMQFVDDGQSVVSVARTEFSLSSAFERGTRQHDRLRRELLSGVRPGASLPVDVVFGPKCPWLCTMSCECLFQPTDGSSTPGSVSGDPSAMVALKRLKYLAAKPHMTAMSPLNGGRSSTDQDRRHLVIGVHGLEGSEHDLGMALAVLRLTLPHENFRFIFSRVNQDDTYQPLESMAKRLADEIQRNVGGVASKKLREVGAISFIGHSLGNLIIRATLSRIDMSYLLPKLHAYISLSGPHCGMLFSQSQLVDVGLWLFRKMKRSAESLVEMSLKDDPANPRNSTLYRLSKSPVLAQFKHVVLVSSKQDMYVPYHSARIEVNPQTTKDQSLLGQVYREMVHNLLSPIARNKSRTTLVRVDVDFVPDRERTADNFLGRAAHVAVIENDAFLVKFFAAAAKYFVTDVRGVETSV